ncbi:cytochrome P450 [Trametes coccinea BRFM310]|uniref:Cytochrome P450 n=1 Tax=Trametes coccinea (strain BRFM310) TaxID=1353009 RepID=A0A1Y2IXB2_TRAC3|nr:cytochrome P450 [Trametes coccinea BRFM310]
MGISTVLSILAKTTLAIILAFLGAILWKLLPIVLPRWFASPLLRLHGPPSTSWLFGNLKEKHLSGDDLLNDKWAKEYGPACIIREFFSMPVLMLTDTRGINHVLTHSAHYFKPSQAQRDLARLLGTGVLLTEGEQHRQQRRIMNPAFGPSQIRELTEIFVEKSNELRDVWAAELDAKGEPTCINVSRGLSKMTLDVIGLAGFNYDFISLSPNGRPNELAKAFEDVFTFPVKIPILMILRNLFPVFEIIKDKRLRDIEHARQMMHRIGSELIAQKKAEILRESSEKKTGGIGRQSLQGRDLLTLLIKANMATDIPDSQRLSDEDVLAQVPTFLVAGHETTNTATTWCLYALTQAPAAQRKLRAELLALDTDTPTMDELMALPYLDMVVRESLRLHAPIPETGRVAMRADVIPLDRPFTDRDGVVHDHVKVAKGDVILIPIKALNRLESLWGPDAHEFRPERWETPPAAISCITGVWGHILTFLGGPRACIGYRFSIVEMKALLYALVRAFEFELAVSPRDIKMTPGIVQRPALRADPTGAVQMPLVVRRYRPSESESAVVAAA